MNTNRFSMRSMENFMIRGFKKKITYENENLILPDGFLGAFKIENLL